MRTRKKGLFAAFSVLVVVLVTSVCAQGLELSGEEKPLFGVARVFGGHGWLGKETRVPSDVLVDEAGGCFYVALWRDAYIKKFRIDGTFVDWLGESAKWDGTFDFPYSVALGPDGNLYMTLDRKNSVFVMTKDGEMVRSFPEPENEADRLKRPKGIAVSPKNNYVYVVDRYNFCVRYFDTSGKEIGRWGSRGPKEGQFYLAAGITINDEGDVYVADTHNHRIQVFDEKGKFIRSFGKRGDGAGEFKYPSDVALAPGGEIFVTDTGNGRIVWFTKTGEFMGAFGRRGTERGQFNQPLGIAVDSKRRVWVADTLNHRVQVFVPKGGM